MSLTDDYIRWLEDFFALCDNNQDKLSEWEKKFVIDQHTRYEEHGAAMSLSPKQRAVLMRIDDKLSGGDGR